MPTITDWAWLAGFLDGEGSFMIAHAPRGGFIAYDCKISASSTDARLLYRCKEIAGGYTNRNSFTPSSKNGYAKAAMIWYLKGLPLDTVLPSVIPFLISKRTQAEILLMMRSEVGRGATKGEWGRKTSLETNERRETFKQAIHALNHRGTSSIEKIKLDSLQITLDLLEKFKTQNNMS